jgi:hypothetical protein
MAYIGVDINYGNIAKQTGTGDGSDTTPIAALTYTVPSNESILVFLDGVAQVPGTDFSATGTTLTFTTAPALAVSILVMFLGRSLDIGTPGDGTVSLAKMAVNSIDSDQYVDGSIDAAHLSANSVDSDAYVDGSIDAVHLSANSVDSDAYVDGSIDLAHMSSESVDEDNLHISNSGSNGNFLSKQSGDSGGLTWAAAGGGFTLATEQATTSGTGITFGSIPTGTKLILVMFEGVSDDVGGDMQVSIGDAGGLETSGYVSSCVQTNTDDTALVRSRTNSFVMSMSTASSIVNGIMILALKDAGNFTWASSHSHGITTVIAAAGGGVKSLSAELTQLKCAVSGASFDAGSINIMYF